MNYQEGRAYSHTFAGKNYNDRYRIKRKAQRWKEKLQRYRLQSAWRSWWRSARLIRCKNRPRGCKNAQICTIFETTFFPCRPSAGGAWRSAQSAQKEVGLARRRGGEQARAKGVRQGVIAIRRLPGAHVDG
jgi:hypothetical protein